MIQNRLEKNLKKLKPWAQRAKIEAYRLYDRDIPEFPYIVDIYGAFILVYDKSDPLMDSGKNHLPTLIEAIKNLFKVAEANIILKKRVRQEGANQYTKIDETNNSFTLRESQALFKINLHDYLDTGLFLDHRPIRYRIYKMATGKNVLNLFCYTGSISVFAALGGAKVTSVDMSNTYIQWAKENFELNNLNTSDHTFVTENALDWMEDNRHKPKYDIIFLDPPTFSNSKKMLKDFDVERDQTFLVDASMDMLKPGGILFFSNNKRKFRIEESLSSKYLIKDISEESIPQDFHDKKIHHCFEIRAK